MKTLNMSQNKCVCYSALYLDPYYTSSYPHPCCINFSSFSNNTATNYYCIYLNKANTAYYITSCNIFNNEETVNGVHGLIFSNGILTIKDSCLMKNSATFTIRGGNTINIINCATDFEKGSTGMTGAVTINSTADLSFINRIQCFETVECYAEFDSIEGVSWRTIEDTYYTAANTKRTNLCNTQQNANKKASLKQETIDAIKYAVLICFLPTESSSFND